MSKKREELTIEEMRSMSLDELKSFRDKSFKILEQEFDKIGQKKKEESEYIYNAIDVISGSCLNMHRRIEVLEEMIRDLLHEKAFEDDFKSYDKGKLN